MHIYTCINVRYSICNMLVLRCHNIILIYINAPYSIFPLRLAFLLLYEFVFILGLYAWMAGKEDSRLAKYCIHSRKPNPLHAQIYVHIHMYFVAYIQTILKLYICIYVFIGVRESVGSHIALSSFVVISINKCYIFLL